PDMAISSFREKLVIGVSALLPNQFHSISDKYSNKIIPHGSYGLIIRLFYYLGVFLNYGA
ncbi:MAG: hypothetical protein V8Q54_05670, partial [Alistipes senegalensis]